jgi:hypothetical protein
VATSAAVSRAAAAPGHAGDHLSKAWANAFGRSPQPDCAYAEAVKAVEAVAIPVVTPKDPTPTLGKVISALRTKPAAWVFVLEEPVSGRIGAETHAPSIDGVNVLALTLDLLWRNHVDRHAASDNQPGRPVSRAQAEFAVHLAIPLVQVFTSRSLRRRDDPCRDTAAL